MLRKFSQLKFLVAILCGKCATNNTRDDPARLRAAHAIGIAIQISHTRLPRPPEPSIVPAALTATSKTMPDLDELPSYKELTFDFGEFSFDCPVGVWRARLRCKAWGKRRNILLYFTEIGTEKGYCISVFKETCHAADDRRIDFRRTGKKGQLFELETGKTRTGRTRFLSARIVTGPEDEGTPGAAADSLAAV